MTNVKVRNIRTREEVDHRVTGWEGQRLYTVNPQGDRRTWTQQGEWLTMNREPAHRVATQETLFGRATA